MVSEVGSWDWGWIDGVGGWGGGSREVGRGLGVGDGVGFDNFGPFWG